MKDFLLKQAQPTNLLVTGKVSGDQMPLHIASDSATPNPVVTSWRRFCRRTRRLAFRVVSCLTLNALVAPNTRTDVVSMATSNFRGLRAREYEC